MVAHGWTPTCPPGTPGVSIHLQRRPHPSAQTCPSLLAANALFKPAALAPSAHGSPSHGPRRPGTCKLARPCPYVQACLSSGCKRTFVGPQHSPPRARIVLPQPSATKYAPARAPLEEQPLSFAAAVGRTLPGHPSPLVAHPLRRPHPYAQAHPSLPAASANALASRTRPPRARNSSPPSQTTRYITHAPGKHGHLPLLVRYQPAPAAHGPSGQARSPPRRTPQHAQDSPAQYGSTSGCSRRIHSAPSPHTIRGAPFSPAAAVGRALPVHPPPRVAHPLRWPLVKAANTQAGPPHSSSSRTDHRADSEALGDQVVQTCAPSEGRPSR